MVKAGKSAKDPARCGRGGMKEAVMKGDGWRVLVVDDDPYIRELVSAALLNHGYDVQSARDGVEALRRLEEGRYEVVLTDYGMPRMNGLQLLAAIRDRWPATPVVFVSGESSETARMAAQKGAYAWLGKPYDLARLLQTVGTAIQGAAPLHSERFSSEIV
jgi:CheY-like chemotaxis protein